MSSGYLETGLTTEALQIHRALASFQEELEAIDVYHQRADRTASETLKAILIHNRDDEMEHAMMLLEWLRCALPALNAEMRIHLFKTLPGEGLGLGNLNEAGAEPRGV